MCREECANNYNDVILHNFLSNLETIEKHTFSLLIFTLLFVTRVCAAADTITVPVKMLVYEHLQNAEVLEAFERRFAQMDNLLEHTVVVDAPNLTYGEDVLSPDADLDSLYRAKGVWESKSFKSRSGLELAGQAYGRPTWITNIFHDEDDPYSSYFAKFQAEVGWNFFNSSFFQRKSALAKIRLVNELEYIKASKDKNKAIYEAAENLLTMQYNYYIAIVLYNELQNIDILNQAYQYMLEQDRVNNEKLLDNINAKMEIEYTLAQTFDIKDVENEPIYILAPTIINVDSTRLFEEVDRYNPDLRASHVEEKLLNTERKLTNYGHEMRLTPFLRAATYLRHNLAPSMNLDLGVRFTFPLYNESLSKRKAIDTEKEILVSGREYMGEEMKSYCRLRLDRIERLNRAIQTETYHVKQLGKYVEIRKNAYLKQPRGYNFLLRLEEYNEYLRGMVRMYKLMLNRALALLDIQKTTSYNNLQSLIIEIPVK